MNKNVKLIKEEKELEAAIVGGDYKSVLTPKRKTDYALAAKNTFAKQKTVNIRISERNLLRLKAVAAREGLSYQTYITALIQKSV